MPSRRETIAVEQPEYSAKAVNLSVLPSKRRAINSRSPITIEFFLDDAAGEKRQTFLGSDIYTELNKAIALIPVADDVPVGSRVVATATDILGNTSEFTPAAVVDTALEEL